jgi:hypothetical protein
MWWPALFPCHVESWAKWFWKLPELNISIVHNSHALFRKDIYLRHWTQHHCCSMMQDYSLPSLPRFMYDIFSPSLLTLSLIEGVKMCGGFAGSQQRWNGKSMYLWWIMASVSFSTWNAQDHVWILARTCAELLLACARYLGCVARTRVSPTTGPRFGFRSVCRLS